MIKALDLPNDKALTADNLKIIADVTEQEIERPMKEQKSFYSGKKATHGKNSLDRLLFDRIDSFSAMRERDNARFSNPEKQ